MSKPKPKAKPRKPRRVWVVWNETMNEPVVARRSRNRARRELECSRANFCGWKYLLRAYVEVLPKPKRKGKK
jgi:hypothetical protein